MTERLWKRMLRPENTRILAMLTDDQRNQLIAQMVADTDKDIAVALGHHKDNDDG